MKLQRLIDRLRGAASDTRRPTHGDAYPVEVYTIAPNSRQRILPARERFKALVMNHSASPVYVGGPAVTDSGATLGHRLAQYDAIELEGDRELYCWFGAYEGETATMTVLIDPED